MNAPTVGKRILDELQAIRAEQLSIRDDLAAILDLLADRPAPDRRLLIKQWVDAKKLIDWLDSEVGRTAVNAALGNRSTASRWAKGESKRTERDRAEGLLRDLNLDPADLPDEVVAADDSEAAA